MIKHRRFGFTVVELLVIIVVIGILASIGTIAYRETQKNARDEKRKTDAIILVGAIEEYYSANGSYPMPTGSTGCAVTDNYCNKPIDEGNFGFMVTQGYLKSIPKSSDHNPFGYIVSRPPHANGSGYSLKAEFIDSTKNCTISKNAISTWWSGTSKCPF